MYIQDFVIPLNKEDLLDSSTTGQFSVKYEYSVEEIRERLEAARILLNEEGTDFIVDHFSTYFSLLQKFKQCPQLDREKGWKTIRKAFNLLSRNLQVLFDDATNIDSDVQNKMCNITKILVYVLIEMMKLQQDQHVEQNSSLLDGKSRKKQTKVSNKDEEWNEEKHDTLIEIHSFLQLPLKMLWEPPVVDEEFVNLIANFCYKCLEDPGISNSNTKYLRETIFQILGILIRNHLHGLSFCVKIVQLLKLNDHLVNPLAQGVIHLVKECGCSNIVKEIVREVADTDGDQLAADTSGTRSLNLFLVQLAESTPEAIIPAINLLVSHLGGDSYSMRICVIGVLGEIVLTVLTKENLDQNMKKMRDEYLDCLEEHIHDVNAFVRTKVLQIWQRLCLGKAIPISRINRLLRLVVGRLNDKSTNVKKQSVHLIKDLLEGNPFCSELNISEIQRQLEEEKRKLELLKKEYNVKEEEPAWEEMKPKLEELLKEDLDELNDLGDALIEEVITSIGKYLAEGEYRKVVTIISNLKNVFYTFYNVKEEDCCSEGLIEILHRIHEQNKKSRMVNASPEVQDEVEKRDKAIEYLEGALEFSELIGRALPIILTFLDSSVVSDVLEAVHFFTAAYLFGFEQALEGVRKMLYLVFSKEPNVKSAVSDAYKELYFQTSGSGRQQSMATVKNLSDLVLKLNYGQLDALEEVVREWMKGGLIDKNCVQIMFERFSMKLPGIRTDHCWAALVLIRMVGAEESKIIKSNVSLLINEGLRSSGSKNFLIAKETCRALNHLLPTKEQGKIFDHSLRYPSDHEVFTNLYNLLKFGIWRTSDPYYIPMADEAVNLVFAICDLPDEFCKNLIVDLHESISSGQRPIEKKNLAYGNVLNTNHGKDLFLFGDGDANKGEMEEEVSKAENATEESEMSENPDELFILLLTRFIGILGQVASNYILFLEGPVLDELKLRNQREYERKLKKFEDNKKVNISLRKNRKGATNETGAVSERNLSETGTEDLEFNRVAADDMDSEEMRKKTENQIVTGKGFLAKFAPLVLAICKNPGKYDNKALQNAALLTLARFMQVSSSFCEENLQLLVTICERSQVSEWQENGMIALGALQYRFPNCLEPWTPHMYAMLDSPNPSVRYSSILVLTHLIVNEMIKVRTHISNLAVCIVDKELKIARVARHFFREYSQKGNSLYNVLPSLISNLTQVNSPLNPKKFKVVMKFILGLVTKEKQSEYLVEKLCQYFETATTPRQWCDLAYCLSLLGYSDKGLKKILDNVRCFAGKLYIAEVYEAFCEIVSDASKNTQKDKTLVKELAEILKGYRDKSVGAVTKTNPPPSTKKKPRRRFLPSESEEEECEGRPRANEQQKRKSEFDEAECEGFLSDASSKRTRASGTTGNKENEISDDDDDDYNSDDDSSKKQTRRTRSSKPVRRKRLKTQNQTSRESSEDDERNESRKMPLRSAIKRK